MCSGSWMSTGDSCGLVTLLILSVFFKQILIFVWSFCISCQSGFRYSTEIGKMQKRGGSCCGDTIPIVFAGPEKRLRMQKCGFFSTLECLIFYFCCGSRHGNGQIKRFACFQASRSSLAATVLFSISAKSCIHQQCNIGALQLCGWWTCRRS